MLCQEHLLVAWSLVQDQLVCEGTPREVQPKRAATDQPYEGYVYYLQVGDRIKIGHTTDAIRRLATYPPESRLIAIRKGSRKRERAEHIRYDKYLADGREWFHYSKEMEEDILIDDDVRGQNQSPEFAQYKELFTRKKAKRRHPVEYRNPRVVG